MKILVIGGSGLVGSQFIDLLSSQFQIDAPTHQDLDLLNPEAVKGYLVDSATEVVINFAAFTNVQKAEEDKDNHDGLVYKLNAKLVGDLAQICKTNNQYLIHLSTEYVFDGQKSDSPYKEDDKPNSVNWYGKTKYFGEQFLSEKGEKFGLVRISMPFRANFEKKSDIARKLVQLLTEKKPIKAISDVKITPIFIDDLCHALAKLIENKAQGIYHLAPTDNLSPFDFVQLIAENFNLETSAVESTTYEEYIKNLSAPLLKNSWLDSQRFRQEFGEEILKNVAAEVHEFKRQVDSSS